MGIARRDLARLELRGGIWRGRNGEVAEVGIVRRDGNCEAGFGTMGFGEVGIGRRDGKCGAGIGAMGNARRDLAR